MTGSDGKNSLWQRITKGKLRKAILMIGAVVPIITFHVGNHLTPITPPPVVWSAQDGRSFRYQPKEPEPFDEIVSTRNTKENYRINRLDNCITMLKRANPLAQGAQAEFIRLRANKSQVYSISYQDIRYGKATWVVPCTVSLTGVA